MPLTVKAGSFIGPQATVLKLSATPDAAGHIDETDESNWRPLGDKRWIRPVPRGSREFFRGEQVAAEITHMIEMRCDSISETYTTWMKIKWRGRTLNLAGPGVNVDEEDRLLRFPAIEVK